MDDNVAVNNLFSKEEINTLRGLIGLHLANVQIQKPSVLLPPDGYIQGIGTVALSFSTPTDSLVIILESLYDEHLELGDIGGFKVLHNFIGHWTAGQSLKSNFDVRGRDAVRFTYPTPPKVASISCFGWKGRGKMSDYGFGDDGSSVESERSLIVDTIELLVLEMEDTSKLVLQSSSGGFLCFFEPNDGNIVEDIKNAFEDKLTLQLLLT